MGQETFFFEDHASIVRLVADQERMESSSGDRDKRIEQISTQLAAIVTIVERHECAHRRVRKLFWTFLSALTAAGGAGAWTLLS